MKMRIWEDTHISYMKMNEGPSKSSPTHFKAGASASYYAPYCIQISFYWEEGKEAEHLSI